MKISNSSYLINTKIDKDEIYKKIEDCGRICYKSHDKIKENSHIKFVKMIMERGHLSVLEHVNLTIEFTLDRALMAELNRHRLTSPSVESTRYVSYDSISCIEPKFKKRDSTALWEKACEMSEYFYMALLDNGEKPEMARSVLPLSLETNAIITANLREWIYILNLRSKSDVHPNLREVIIAINNELAILLPEIFNII